LIGWNPADWQMIDPLIQGSKMPTLQPLGNEGVGGNMATLQTILSPMLWTSFGRALDEHRHR